MTLKATNVADARLECEALAKLINRQADEQPLDLRALKDGQWQLFTGDASRGDDRVEMVYRGEPSTEFRSFSFTHGDEFSEISALMSRGDGHAVDEFCERVWNKRGLRAKVRAPDSFRLHTADPSTASGETEVSYAGYHPAATPTINPPGDLVPRTEPEATYASYHWQPVDENGKTADDNIRAELAAIRKAMTTGQHSRVKDEAHGALNMIEQRLLPGDCKNGPIEVPIWYLKSHEERVPGFARSWWSPRGDTRVSVRLEGKSECFLAQPHQVIPRELPASQLLDLMLKAVAIENGDLPRPRPQPLASERWLDYPLREGAKVGPLELSSFTFKGEEFWHVKIQAPDYARFAEYDDQFAVVVEGPRDRIDALTRAWIQSIAALLPSEDE